MTINKSLTLLGDPGGTTVGPGPNAPALDGTGAAGKGIAIEANDVTVSGIVIQNYNTLGTVEPDGIALCDVNNVTISHDRIDNNNYGITIDQQLGSNCSNTTTGTSSNVQVLDNVITHSLWPASCSPNSGCDFEGGIAVTSWYSVGTNLTISGNQIENQNRNGILTGPGSGVQITDNTVSNSGWEAIEADDTASAVIQGNAVSGGYPNSTTNPLYPIGILAYATHGSATTTMSNPQIAGNSVSGASPGGGIPAIVRGVVLQADSGYSLTGVSITGNSLHAFSTAGIYLGPGTVTNTTAHFNDLSGDAIGVDNTVPADPVNATDNWWGSANGPATSANTYNRGSQGIAVTSGVTFAPWLTAAPALAAASGADFAPATDTTSGAKFASIQAAVDAATAGDTVQVAAGTYSEQVTIGKALTLRGDPGSAGTSGPGSSAPVLDGSDNPNTGIAIASPADGVTVEGFVIQNYNNTKSTNANAFGIALCNANHVAINHNLIQDNGNGIALEQGPAPCGAGGGTQPGSDNVDITWNVIANNHWPAGSGPDANGYWAWGGIGITSWYSTGSNLTIANNTISDHDRNGILTGPDNGVQILDNTISNSGWEGVECDSTMNAVIEGNQISGGYPSATAYAPDGIVAFATNGNTSSLLTMTGLQVTGNTISGAASGNGAPGIGWGIYLTAVPSYGIDGAVITSNHVTGIIVPSVDGAATAAIEIPQDNSDPPAPFTPPLTSGGSWSTGTISNTAVHSNDLSNNSTGFANTTASTVDATDNWWGSPSGPYNASSNASGTGSPVTANVAFSPWWTTSNGLPPAPTVVTTTGTVNAGGSFTSDPAGTVPTGSNPVVVSITSPNAGSVSITKGSTSPTVTGYSTLGINSQISAPAATAAQPLKLTFQVYVGGLPAGSYPGDVTVFRDGTPIPACPGASTASPDPCVTSSSVAGGVETFTVLSSHASSWDLETANVGRLAGADRYATAVAVSQAQFPNGNAGAVVLARGDLYPDALVGVPLAAAKNAPLLLTVGSSLLTVTKAELQRVLPAGGTVYILGGTGAVPTSVASQLTGLGYQVLRYGGASRFATAVQVAHALGDPGIVL
ncbi:MAG: cell wall-binding repeat-containing protein, partial [Actinomycetes bacterium]